MRRSLSPLALGALLASLAPPAVAQDYDPQQLAKVARVHIAVFDQSHADCLPAPDALRQAAAAILRDGGITVSAAADGGAFLLEIQSTAVATDATDTGAGDCFGNVQIKLTRGEVLADRTAGVVIAAHDGRVGRADRAVFAARFRAAVEAMVTDLVHRIHRAQTL